MNKITFVNGQEPALNGNNLNLIQTNAESAIETAKSEAISAASADATNKVNSAKTTLRSEISTAQSNATGTAQTYTDNKVKNGTLTIQRNGTNVATFSANQSSNATANISVPTVNNAILTIQKNGSNVATFGANASSNVTANITVPTVNNATLTIQRNGSNVGTFSANASSNKTINITVPTNNNQLTNGAGYIKNDGTSGTSGIWNYIKFNNGMAICMGTQSVSTKVSRTWGNVYLSDAISFPNFPFTFVSAPSVSFSTVGVSSDNTSAWVMNTGTVLSTNNPGQVNLVRGNSLNSNYTYYISVFAMGFWK